MKIQQTKNIKTSNDWITKQINLDILLTNTNAVVTNSFVCTKIHKEITELKLVGKKVSLLEVCVADKKLKPSQYTIDKNILIIKKLTEKSYFISIKTEISFANYKKEGMFLADKKIFTLNGKNSFNHITYFFEDPFLQVHFSCKITASKEKFPYLLSDGELVEQGMHKTEHWVLWKSCCARAIYQFSIVAGNFFVLKDKVLIGDKSIEVAIYVPDVYQDYCNYLLDALRRIIQIDYKSFQLFYHTKTFQIVALKNYKEYIIEGKELNIFDIHSIAVSPKTASYLDYLQAELCLAKKFFLTSCKKNIQKLDWFYYTFSQAFGLLRLQEYIALRYGRIYQSIEFAKTVKNLEIVEKEQILPPTEFFSHSRNYFQDYYKIVRVFQMLCLGIGKKQFFPVLCSYFQQCKKQETTLEGFLIFLQTNIKKKIPHLEYWFTKSDLPQVKILEYYNNPLKKYQLLYFQIDKDKVIPQNKKHWRDFLVSYEDQARAKHFLDADYPIKKLALNNSLKQLPLTLDPFPIFLTVDYKDMDSTNVNDRQYSKQKVVEIKKNYNKDFIFDDSPKVTPFFNHGLIAPINIQYNGEEYPLFLYSEELDQYTSWYLYHTFFLKIFSEQLERYLNDKLTYIDDSFLIYLQKIIVKLSFRNIFIYQSLCFPTEEELFWLVPQKNTEAIYYIRNYFQQFSGQKFANNFVNLYQKNELENDFSLDKKDFFRRLLRNKCLEFIAHSDEKDLIMEQYKNSKKCEDIFSAIKAFNNFDCPERAVMLEETEKKWKKNRFLFAKWFQIQATSKRPTAMDDIEKIAQHPELEKKTYFAKTFFFYFAFHNSYYFHHISGRGYELVKNFILSIDKIDTDISCNLVLAFAAKKGFSKIKEQKKRECLENILSQKITRELNKAIKYLIE